jgi:two-component system nitrate/nitrite response regulator NarL
MTMTDGRVVVVDDHALVGNGLAVLLGRRGVQADFATGREAQAGASTAGADVVVLDLDLEDGIDGVDLIGPLAESGARVLVCTGETDPARLGRCLEAGAVGVFAKSRPTAELVAAVLDVVERRPCMRAGERDELLAALRARRADEEQRLHLFANLTHREAHVLSGLMAGLAPAVMAKGADVSLKTVRNQIDSVLQKLGVRTQLQAVRAAREAGWSA